MTKIGSSQEIGELLKKIKQETELSYVKQASERYSNEFDKITDDLLDFSSSSFNQELLNLDSPIEEILSQIIHFLNDSLNRTDRISVQLREWYAAHTPEAPHIMHIPLHPAHDTALHPESLKRLGADFKSFTDYDNFLKKVRTQIDICKNCKFFLEEQKQFIENSDLSYINLQLGLSEKEILAQTLLDFEPAIENVLIHFQNFNAKMPGNLYADGGFIGTAFSKTNIAALELYRIKKILVLLKEGMNSEHLHLYQKVFESQIRLNKLLTKAISKHGLDSLQARLYSAQAEAARLAKRYIEEAHQLTQSKLTVDIQEVATWYSKGTINIKHPLHKENPQNILRDIKDDFLLTTNIEKIQKLFKGSEAKYLQAIKQISNKQKMIEKYINFDRDFEINDFEIVKALVKLHKNDGRLSKSIDSKIVKEALNNIGISSSYLDEIENEILKITKREKTLCFNKVINSALKLSPEINKDKFDQLLAIWLNVDYFPLGENGFKIHTEFFINLFTENHVSDYALNFFIKEFTELHHQELSIEELQNVVERFEKERGPNQDLNIIQEIIIKVCFLSTRVHSLNIYNKITRQRLNFHDLFFGHAGETEEQVKAWNSYQYLSWAQSIAKEFNTNDDKMIWLLLSNKLNIKTCFQSLKYLSRLNTSRENLINDLSKFGLRDGKKHLFDIETSFFENFKNESNISSILCRGGSCFDIQAMDIICEIIQIQYADIVNYKHKYFAHRIDQVFDPETGIPKTHINYFGQHINSDNSKLKTNFGAHRLSRQQYYALWGVRSGLYYNLNHLKEKDISILLKQFKHLMELGDILEILIAETSHDQWFGNIYEHYQIKSFEMKWFQKINLLNNYLRKKPQTREVLDLFKYLDKEYIFDPQAAETHLKEFKRIFSTNFEEAREEELKSIQKYDFNRDSKLNTIDFRYLYQVICYHFNELEISKDAFYQTLIFNLFNLSNMEYFHEQKFKLSRFNQAKRDQFDKISEFYKELVFRIDDFARKVNTLLLNEKLKNISELFKKLYKLQIEFEKNQDPTIILKITTLLDTFLT